MVMALRRIGDDSESFPFTTLPMPLMASPKKFAYCPNLFCMLIGDFTGKTGEGDPVRIPGVPRDGELSIFALYVITRSSTFALALFLTNSNSGCSTTILSITRYDEAFACARKAPPLSAESANDSSSYFKFSLEP